jgi:hypothetical protein
VGLLRDIRSKPHYPLGGPFTIVFWAAVGAVVGGGFASVTHLPAAAAIVLVTMFGVLGIGVGFYACFGITKLAQALALPGAILEIILGPFA